MHIKCLIVLVLWLHYIDKIQCNETCWNNENECNIKTELFKNVQFSNGISMQIDCGLNLLANSQDHLKKDERNIKTTAKYVLLPRFMGVQSVLLDGCQTPLNVHTFGLELLPICANIKKASIRYFYMDTLKPLYCHGTPEELQLESLNIQFNEMAVIDKDSFPQSYSYLKNVLIEKNLLKVIRKDAFTSIKRLDNLYIVNEPVYMLKFPDLFEYSSLSTIHLEMLKQMTSDIFQHLPDTLKNFYVANTPLDNDTVLLKNSLALKNLTIKNCALQKFTLRDVHSTVKHIDLSSNVMKTFTAYENNLNELNLSDNQLEWLPIEWLINLTNLESLIVKRNHIKVLQLNNLLKATPNIHACDLSQNRLHSIQDYEDSIENVQLTQVRIKGDQNPWDCLWLHEFAHYNPEKFRILQYEKFISKINVNGLECIPAEKPIDQSVITQNVPNNNSNVSIDRIVNISAYTLVYGNSWEYKRNQRAEALIIVFMLPLGIAFLFMLLYMWIYCEKVFHLSYYQDLSCMRRSANHSAQRFDIVRQLPPRLNQTEPRRPLTRISDENEEGYEIPINGIVPECNCMMQHNDEMDECQKDVHITYEYLPTEEPPHRIYEEIIQVGACDGCIETLSRIKDADKETYDHLSFR